MRKILTRNELEAIELCQIEGTECGNCNNCPARNCDCMKDPVATALILLQENQILKEKIKNGGEK